MSERISSAQERPYINESGLAISSYLEGQGYPHHSIKTLLAEIIDENGDRAPWGTLVSAQANIGAVTLVTARMMDENHEGLPESWNGDPETARAVLTMAGHIEAGSIRAMRLDLGSEFDDARLLAIEGLIDSLQAK